MARFPWNFAPGIEYRYLRPHEGRGIYRFETIRKTTYPLHFDHPDVRFVDVHGIEWARIEGNLLSIRTGYAWNGCSPKRQWCGIWWGTPDFMFTRRASLVHDVLFQVSGCKHFRATMEQCNEVFRRIMVRDGGTAAMVGIYHAAVQRFGGSFFGKVDGNVRGEVISD
jgi:hypothetical protein